MCFWEASFEGSDDMTPPSIQRVIRNNEPIFKVSVCGMEFYHRQDWQAAWHFEQACIFYRGQLEKRGG